ncbi:MAG TPA: transcriptional regulator [Phycisphaerales bacterium]|nr:transcriptional regulator [Phycisphaerales bacterium]
MVEHCEPSLNQAFAALADPTRRWLVARLRSRGESTVTALAGPLPMSLQAVSKHLVVLERAGLVRRRRAGREHRVALEGRALKAVAEWVNEYQRFWEDRLDALAAHMERQALEIERTDPKEHQQ